MFYIGVDIGGTTIKAGIVSENGHIILKKSIPTSSGHKIIAKDIADLVLSMLQAEKISLNEVMSVGIGWPGTVDNDAGTLVCTNNISVEENAPLRDELQKYIQKPVYLGNDADCAALGEFFAMGDDTIKNLIAVTFGTGVGCGIIINKKIYSGSFGSGGEAGHIVIVMDGKECTCGRKGCWEAYASATALVKDATECAQKNSSSLLFKKLKERGKLNGKIVFDCAHFGDETAMSVVDRYIKYIGEGVANLVNVLQPEYVVLGGGISNQKEALVDPVREYVSKRIYGAGTVPCPKIVPAKMGNDAGIIGAAFLAR